MQIKRLLLVDDDPEDIEFFTMAATEVAPEVVITAVSSKEELFLKLQETQPDIVFMDSFIRMDSGVQCMAEIKTVGVHTNLPVIMYTGSDDRRQIEKSFENGASAYIVKPHTLAEVKEVLLHSFQQDWKDRTKKIFYMNGKFQEL